MNIKRIYVDLIVDSDIEQEVCRMLEEKGIIATSNRICMNTNIVQNILDFFIDSKDFLIGLASVIISLRKKKKRVVIKYEVTEGEDKKSLAIDLTNCSEEECIKYFQQATQYDLFVVKDEK